MCSEREWHLYTCSVDVQYNYTYMGEKDYISNSLMMLERNRIKVELLASWSFSAPLGIIILCNVLINMLTGFPLSKVGWAILEKNSWLSYSHSEK